MRSYKCCNSSTQESKNIVAQSSLLKLIADESRLKLLCILRSGTHCVCELMEHTDMSQSLISHHLADLRGAGIVQDEKTGRQVNYSLSTKGKQVIGLLVSLSSKE
ncbi:winged helix-turn-helix transcriptional regulator [Candidatus Woesebacteria bacterium]|nr:winged helix-turn-helix transcriptional regulator [Candidatus Woesebacteria bacterium]